MSDPRTFSKDPTCGMNVDVATALQGERDGKIYFFCSEPCQQAFQSVSEGTSKTCV